MHGETSEGGHRRTFPPPVLSHNQLSAVRRVTADFDFTGLPPYNLFVLNVLECVSMRTLPAS